MCVVGSLGHTRSVGLEPNPPQWPVNVGVFDAKNQNNAKKFINTAFASNGGDCNHGQFSHDHYAMLFKPGRYSVDVPVGYYTQVVTASTGR